jgi:hypothetical protein
MAAEMKVTKEALRAAMNAEFCGVRTSDALMFGTDYDTEVLEAALQAALAAMLEPVMWKHEGCSWVPVNECLIATRGRIEYLYRIKP